MPYVSIFNDRHHKKYLTCSKVTWYKSFSGIITDPAKVGCKATPCNKQKVIKPSGNPLSTMSHCLYRASRISHKELDEAISQSSRYIAVWLEEHSIHNAFCNTPHKYLTHFLPQHPPFSSLRLKLSEQ